MTREVITLPTGPRLKYTYYEDGIVFPKSQCAGGPGGSGNLEACLPG
jgi:hypothetical protein